MYRSGMSMRGVLKTEDDHGFDWTWPALLMMALFCAAVFAWRL